MSHIARELAHSSPCFNETRLSILTWEKQGSSNLSVFLPITCLPTRFLTQAPMSIFNSLDFQVGCLVK